MIDYKITAGGTAIFVFIAGFLFQYLSDNFNYKVYLTKKFINVILPYIITCIPGALLCLFPVWALPFSDLNIFIQIPCALLTGSYNGPTWYIPMTTIFFLVAPVLDVFFAVKYNWQNVTLSKILLTFILLSYLKYFDSEIISHSKINHFADVIAKHSFAIFFLHFYYIMLFKLILKVCFHLPTRIAIENSADLCYAVVFSLTCFVFSVLCSLFTSIPVKKILSSIGIKNTRMIIGA
ncbi:MAG: acyltransferase family protein [Candidatus Avigastranaerophilus sp.]